jgi:type I restriction enzyme S subunit
MGKSMATSQDFVNWTPTEAVTSDWLRTVFGADKESLRRFGKGTVHKTIYFPEWLSVHIALPPLEEQKVIVAEIDKLLSSIEYHFRVVDEALAQAVALRQSILKRAFSGQLVPQDPADEPASVLLARIRAERKVNGTTKRPNTKNGKKEAA